MNLLLKYFDSERVRKGKEVAVKKMCERELLDEEIEALLTRLTYVKSEDD